MIVQVADRLKVVEDYYFVKKLEEIGKMQKEGKKVISFGIGSPDLPPSEETLDALTASAHHAKNHGYQPYRGTPDFRQAIADWYEKTYEVKLDPNTQVLPLMGSKEGILHISMAFLNPGDKALIPNPGYPTYTSNTKLIGAVPYYYDLVEANGWYPDLKALAKQDLTGVKIMWINYPHMPTGAPADRERLAEIVAFAKEKKILLVNDNPYSLVLNQAKPISILSIPGADEVAIELNSLSKSFNMPGWRVGMMLGKAEYLAAAVRVKSNVDSGMFLAMQHAAIKALGNSDEWHAQRNAIYAERRRLIEEIIEMLGCTYDKKQTGMFVWAKVPDSISDATAYVDQILQEKHIFITPGSIFGSNGDRYIRFSLCLPVEQIKEAHDRLK